jgi:hypothetical protein
LTSAVQAVVDIVNTFSTRLTATSVGNKVRLQIADPTFGANGNRWGAYAYVSGAGTETWSPWYGRFSGGQSPTKWRVSLNFGALTAIDGRTVPKSWIRKMRWTYAADFQDGAFERSEFQVQLSNWIVSGTGTAYQVASQASRRVEDDDTAIQYEDGWTKSIGNFSGSTIRYATTAGISFTYSYLSPEAHTLYLGTRYAYNGATVNVQVDGGLAHSKNLAIDGEDSLARVKIADLGAGTHSVTVTHGGPSGNCVYFDFLEIVIPTVNLPSLPIADQLTLATDWDTDHSIALPPERTAWILYSLGYRGRANHYVGALWFYELTRQGHIYASATVTFSGTPQFSATTTITVGVVGSSGTDISHVNRIGDTAETIAKAFELELNRGYTAIRAEASGNVLTIFARQMGKAGEDNTISAAPTAGVFTATASSGMLQGAENGEWRTDLEALPRINRAARDWCRAYYTALRGYGIDVTAAFSTELQHGDPSAAAGIAQRYGNGDPVLLNTPALQTNFSPASLAYWKDVYLGMAATQVEAGLQPYLQFGEVQWWYFAKTGAGMTFYDDYTKTAFQTQYGAPMQVIPSEQADPALYPDEVTFLPTLIGAFTDSIMSYVKAAYPSCRFEVLYPTDVNNTALNKLINYPAAAWTPAQLDCLKTESFGFTYARDLNLSRITVNYGGTRNFSRGKRSFLVGIGDATRPWKKEMGMAQSEALESVVLFALDQYCLVGYVTPLAKTKRRCAFQG